VGQLAAKFGLSRRMMYRWRDIPEHKARRKPLWEAAIRLAGGAHAELGLEALVALQSKESLSPAEVTLASALAKHRQWLAGKLDPEGYGDRGVELNFSFGELHLRAIQRPRPTVEGVPVAEGLSGGSGEEDDAQASERQLPPPSAPIVDDDELWEMMT
jgi:hypothetical protein